MLVARGALDRVIQTPCRTRGMVSPLRRRCDGLLSVRWAEPIGVWRYVGPGSVESRDWNQPGKVGSNRREPTGFCMSSAMLFDVLYPNNQEPVWSGIRE